MRALTESERRGVLLVAALFLLGAGYDLLRSSRAGKNLSDSSRRQTHLDPAGATPGFATDDGGAGRIPEGPPPGDPEARPLDLNRASASELEALDGIGPKLAARIVEHRRVNGPFGAVDELLAVRGIGPRLLERVRGRLEVPKRPG